MEPTYDSKKCQAGKAADSRRHEDEHRRYFHEPPSGWSFDPNEQNFFHGIRSRDDACHEEEMHAAWDAYCNAKVDKMGFQRKFGML